VQIFVTGLLIRAVSRDSGDLASFAKEMEDNNLLRRLLYGEGGLRKSLEVCRWLRSKDGIGEVPPDRISCHPDRLDVAIQTAAPETFDTSGYEEIFKGQIDRLHVCRSCQPDIVIDATKAGTLLSRSHSVFGLLILALPFTGRQLIQQKFRVMQDVEHIKALLGSWYLRLPDSEHDIGVTDLQSTGPVLANVTLLVIVALWLALRAHRKVLDYFAHNHALLPLVAACGKRSFYAAIWLLTLLRVGCFLLAAIPLICFGLKEFGGSKVVQEFSLSIGYTFIWLITMFVTLALATVIASVAELKHRQNVFNYFYRYVPIGCAVFGGIAWTVSFLFVTPGATSFRYALGGLPVMGMVPILASPILRLPLWALLAHMVGASAGLWWILTRNSRWFAAHLEEL